MSKRVIIFAPHQDDEILGCAGTINLLKKLGTDVVIVFATNGDFYGKENAAIRLRESIMALKNLNISEEKIIVLGFADTGMAYDESFLWKLYHSYEIIKSPVSSVTYHPFGLEEYSLKKFGIHLPYCKDAFSQTIEYLINDMRPDAIFTSSSLDAHGDHAALCWFVEDAVNKTDINIPIYQYIIHSGNDKEWPQRQTMYYSKPQNITDKLWEKRIIVPVDLTLNKKKLIQIFCSQLSPSGYLLSFAKNEEIFFELKR